MSACGADNQYAAPPPPLNLDTATRSRDSAQATQQQDDASTQLAAINLGYTHVRAPFDGVVTARQVSVGAMVGSTPTVQDPPA